jgi:uncharacterized membrane protein YozB (DUF420 family)
MSSENEFERSKQFVPRTGPIVGSVSVIIGWLVFILLYALYWSKGFDLFQNIIVTMVSLATTGLLICGVLMIWYRPNGELRKKSKQVE